MRTLINALMRELRVAAARRSCGPTTTGAAGTTTSGRRRSTLRLRLPRAGAAGEPLRAARRRRHTPLDFTSILRSSRRTGVSRRSRARCRGGRALLAAFDFASAPRAPRSGAAARRRPAPDARQSGVSTSSYGAALLVGAVAGREPLVALGRWGCRSSSLVAVLACAWRAPVGKSQAATLDVRTVPARPGVRVAAQRSGAEDRWARRGAPTGRRAHRRGPARPYTARGRREGAGHRPEPGACTPGSRAGTPRRVAPLRPPSGTMLHAALDLSYAVTPRLRRPRRRNRGPAGVGLSCVRGSDGARHVFRGPRTCACTGTRVARIGSAAASPGDPVQRRSAWWSTGRTSSTRDSSASIPTRARQLTFGVRFYSATIRRARRALRVPDRIGDSAPPSRRHGGAGYRLD